jgi:hypothetical protein
MRVTLPRFPNLTIALHLAASSNSQFLVPMGLEGTEESGCLEVGASPKSLLCSCHLTQAHLPQGHLLLTFHLGFSFLFLFYRF